MIRHKSTGSIYRQLTALAGAFEVGKQLALRGYNVSLTQRNFPHVDLFVQNPLNNKSVPVQVKAQREPNPGGFDLTKENLRLDGLIVVYVALETKEGKPEFFIATAPEASKYVVGEKRPGIARSQLLKLNWRNRWDKIEKALE